jgi:hypothetical protein
MATKKQQEAARRNVRKAQARRNVRKAQEARQQMSSRERSAAQPRGRRRRQPGTTGEGNYYHVVVRRKDDFLTFRTQDVGDPGHVQRVAGKRESGSWDTVKWLIAKEDAHIENDRLVPDTADAREVLRDLGSEPVHIKGDLFEARPRPNVAEEDKPTPAQRKARRENIEKAQSSRRRRST